MKKIISTLLLICMFTLCLTSCLNGSGSGEGNSDGENSGNTGNPAIQLTLDNYEDYFDIDTGISIGHTTSCMYNGDFLDLVKTLKCEIEFSGNPNYEYTDVVFIVKFVHTGPTNFVTHNAESTVIVDINLAGNGSGYTYVETPVAREEWDNISRSTYAFYRPSEVSVAMGYSSYEIVEVSGTVTKN